MRPAFLILAIAFLLAATCCFAQEEAVKPALTTDELVELLVSPNKPVNPEHEPFVGFPKSYDKEAQKKIDDAAVQLTERDFEAIPALIRHLDDKRYCRSRAYSVVVDFSVGAVCYELIERIVTPKAKPNYSVLLEAQFKEVKGYPMRVGIDGNWHDVGRSYFFALRQQDKNFNLQSLPKWWEDHKFKSIEAVHFAAIEQIVAYEDSIGFPKNVNRNEYLKPYLELQQVLRERVSSKK